MVLHINELALGEGRSEFKRGQGGRREAVGRSQHPAPSAAQQHHDRRQELPPTGAAGASRAGRRDLSQEPSRAASPSRSTTHRLPPRVPAPHRAPPASMRLLAAALLLLLLALCASRVDGECREGPRSPSRPLEGSPCTT